MDETNCTLVIRQDGSIAESVPDWNREVLSDIITTPEMTFERGIDGCRVASKNPGGEFPIVDIEELEASRKMAKAWQSISNALPEFYFTFLWQVIHEAITDKTTTVNLSKSVCELALYIDLTGAVPDDPFVFFDFNK